MSPTTRARQAGTLAATSTVFIVGAGFSLEANTNRSREAVQRSIAYPTLADLAEKCFSPSIPPEEVEREFSSRYWKRRRKALKILSSLIDQADYWIGDEEARKPESIYHRLLDAYPFSHFISYNYDCLLELVLSRRGEWFPHDGFGVRARVGDSRTPERVNPRPKSKHLGLHLHGSMRLYSVQHEFYESWSTLRPKPLYVFDPERLAFGLGRGASPRDKWGPIPWNWEYRFIAPIEGKGEFFRTGGLISENYYSAVLKRARTLLGATRKAIAIGYRFADSDIDSWLPLLESIETAEINLLVVAPDADEIVNRLARRFESLRIRGIATTLGGWAMNGFKE
jgi:hypothetical protein